MLNSIFKKTAKSHQERYRIQYISREYNKYVTWLTNDCGILGNNFYGGFSVFSAVGMRFPRFNVSLYCDMLRSQHIPFNLFVPLKSNLDYCKDVLNKILGGCVKSVSSKCFIDGNDNIKIEFSPYPAFRYLNDMTSFDCYIEYDHIDGTKGVVGIEVKYTEREYPLKTNSTEHKRVNDRMSPYYSVTDRSGIYKDERIDSLRTDILRQIWRNQLLGESIRLEHGNVIGHSSSILLFPKDNGHFPEACDHYQSTLRGEGDFIPLTYERFIQICSDLSPDGSYNHWLTYLTKRYLI